MVSLDKAVIARIENKGKKFEILVDSEKAFSFRSGTPHSMENILAVNDVFKDAKKAERHSPSALKEAFGTEDIFKVAEQIIKKGEIQLTTEQRKKMVEEKRNKLVSIIARNAINPQTNTPHPPARIESMMEQVKLNIDPFTPAEEQLPKVLDALKPLIPIKFEKRRLACRFPPTFAPRSVGLVKKLAEIKREAWGNDGSWLCEVEIPAGMTEEFLDAVNKETHGQVQVKIMEK